MESGFDWVADINSIGLQWYQTITRKPAAPPPPVVPSPTPGTPTATLGSFTGVWIVAAVLALVALALWLALRR